MPLPNPYDYNPKHKLKLRPTADPVMGFLHRQAETYGYGYVPPELGGQTAPEILQECRKRTMAAAQQLMGTGAYRASHQIGVSRFTVRHVKGDLTNRMTAYHLRLMQALLLAHIGGVRQTLTDIERELWVTMQLTHHPLIEKFASFDRHQHTARKKMQIAIGRVKTDKAESFPISYLKLMPVRAAAITKYPGERETDAVVRELQDQINVGKLNRGGTWKHMLMEIPNGVTATKKRRAAAEGKQYPPPKRKNVPTREATNKGLNTIKANRKRAKSLKELEKIAFRVTPLPPEREN